MSSTLLSSIQFRCRNRSLNIDSDSSNERLSSDKFSNYKLPRNRSVLVWNYGVVISEFIDFKIIHHTKRWSTWTRYTTINIYMTLSNHNVLEKITTLFNYHLPGTTLPRKFGDFLRTFDFLFVQCHKINTVKVLLKMTTKIYPGNAIVSNFQYAQCFCLQF
jgi:hypothetical protein